MEDKFKKSMNTRDQDYYKAKYPDRLVAPPASAADDIAFALDELMQKNIDRKTWVFRFPLEERPNDSYSIIALPVITMGIMLYEPRKSKIDWMINGSRRKPEELNGIEDAFEGFIKKLEWEDE